MGESQRRYAARVGKDVINLRSREWRARKGVDHVRDIRLKNRYGMPRGEFSARMESQSGRCAICLCPETRFVKGVKTPLSVDHDHATGAIRGLLCNRCNVALGYVESVRGLIPSMLRYLESGGIPFDPSAGPLFERNGPA